MLPKNITKYMHLQLGLAKPAGTRPVQPVPDGTGPTRYMNRSGSHPKLCLQTHMNGEPTGFTGKPDQFFPSGNRPVHGFVNPACRRMT
jgi:hypothetical protein